MERATLLRYAASLREPVDAPAASEPPFVASAERYRSAERFERERALVARSPRIVAASSELAPGACLPVDVPGTSAILTRTADGALHGFANACRHRGTRLVDAPCRAKAITCPYHAWTYDLAGALLHVPHERSFGGLAGGRDLRPIAVAEQAGLVWLGEPAAELAADLAALELDRHVVYRRSRVERRCNWKLVIEAFLDGYHIRSLHRDTIYRFFLDASVVAEPCGPHIRAVVGRRGLLEAPDLAACDLRAVTTPSFTVFPATVIVVHPDFVSIMTVTPLAPDVTGWEHAMLIPAARAAEADHWARSWELIEDGVFQREDLWICEQAQRAISSGAADELVFGTLERSVRWFHAALDARL